MTPPLWLPEVRSLAEDVGVVARGRLGALAAVTISVPPPADPNAVATDLAEQLNRLGMPSVTIHTHTAPGPASILTIEFHR